MDVPVLDRRVDDGIGYMDLVKRDNLKIATYNVLPAPKCGISRWLSAPRLRYNYQIDTLLPSLDADIIFLQGCTREYLRLLLQSSLLEKYMGSSHEATRDKQNFPVVLSTIPFEELLIRDRAIYCLFECNNKPFVLINIHLNTLGSSKSMRAIELSKINQNLQIICELADDESQKSRIRQALDNNNIMILGDFNMHFPSENKTLESLNYTDLWLDKHSHLSGYTYDGKTNKLLWSLQQFDNRRLRLDRIALKRHSQIEAENIQLFGNKPINPWFKQRLFPTMPSDHYGIMLKFKINDVKTEDNRFGMYHDEFGMLPRNTTGYRSPMKIWVYRIIASWVVFITLALLCYYLCSFFNAS
ncbi:unnamed protein product [Moneuplotes crassus]|uniref:Endonuclease/exonuclease/phosphatase domain-containing protein n=1 Tax=Euplotes crassus TaxID=5936 RepID=A0AAD1XIK6_EUPCR|nr:unnamed protein product [Moneuplotes crassus]